MVSFFSSQLDFIYFFYGLAFILLGVTCWAIARSSVVRVAWAALSGFAFLHGVGEWLDLSALIIGDSHAFAIVRAVVMTASFVLLLEFSRIEAGRLGLVLAGRWIYVPLLLVVALTGMASGLSVAAIAARYLLGFAGAISASIVLARQATTFSGGARRFALLASVGFALYALAAGVVVPAAPFWPADVINYETFFTATGVPIQLVRGLLACWISFSIWAIWGEQLAAEASSSRYTRYVRDQFTWTLVTMATILVLGWGLTEFLGGIYRQNVQDQAAADIDLLASHLGGDTAIIDGMVKALAGSPSVLPLLQRGTHTDDKDAPSALDLFVEASGANHGYILNDSGAVVASSDHRALVADEPGFRSATWFNTSMAGNAGHGFPMDLQRGVRDYCASQPIRTAAGTIVGVAVLTRSLDGFEADLRSFDRPYFFVDPEGIVVMTNRPEALLRPLWPLDHVQRSELMQRYGRLNGEPMLDSELRDATWTSVDSERNFVRRRFVKHGRWSLVILKPTREIFASRLLGIVITLLVTMMALVYLIGKGRWVHDDVRAETRARLQELTLALGVKAATDPLTGLHNRMLLEQTLVHEMARADRYSAPLSLVLFDVDHFKRVNDTYGHQVGDRVLVQLSRFVPNLIRASDFLVRWGGEEFLIVIPESDGAMALRVAEKLREAISHVVFGAAGSITCSFGVTEYACGESAADFIGRADDALYRAKNDGRNNVKLTPPHGPAATRLVAAD
jgi:diguanylate cyclase (GGDEF)-like protein